jgi:hypothetical protein
VSEPAVRTPIRQMAIEEMAAAGCDLDDLLAVESAWMITWGKLEGRNEITAYASEDDEDGRLIVLPPS